MAQNFRRYTSNAVGTGPAAVYSPNSYDAIVEYLYQIYFPHPSL